MARRPTRRLESVSWPKHDARTTSQRRWKGRSESCGAISSLLRAKVETVDRADQARSFLIRTLANDFAKQKRKNDSIYTSPIPEKWTSLSSMPESHKWLACRPIASQLVPQPNANRIRMFYSSRRLCAGRSLSVNSCKADTRPLARPWAPSNSRSIPGLYGTITKVR